MAEVKSKWTKKDLEGFIVGEASCVFCGEPNKVKSVNDIEVKPITIVTHGYEQKGKWPAFKCNRCELWTHICPPGSEE